MNYGDARRGLRTIFARLSGLPEANIASPDTRAAVPSFGAAYPSGPVGSALQIKFKLFGDRELMYDERGGYDPLVQPPGDTYSGPGAPLGSYVYTVSFQGQVTCSVRIETIDQTDDGTAFPAALKLARGLRLPSVSDSMQDLGLSIANIGDVRDLSYAENGRQKSAAQFDVLLNTSHEITDDPLTTIESFTFDPSSTPQ